MSLDTPFPGAGLTPNLIPNAPPDMPDAPGPGDAMGRVSAFNEPQDVDSIKNQLELDRPLKLFIPDRHRYLEDFRIINSNPQEIAAAHNKGFRQVTHPDLVRLFDNLVAGTDKEGKAYRPLLFGRPPAISAHIERLSRQKKASIYAGRDPRNKDLNGKYTSGVDAQAGTKAQFNGFGFNIKVV